VTVILIVLQFYSVLGILISDGKEIAWTKKTDGMAGVRGNLKPLMMIEVKKIAIDSEKISRREFSSKHDCAIK